METLCPVAGYLQSTPASLQTMCMTWHVLTPAKTVSSTKGIKDAVSLHRVRRPWLEGSLSCFAQSLLYGRVLSVPLLHELTRRSGLTLLSPCLSESRCPLSWLLTRRL